MLIPQISPTRQWLTPKPCAGSNRFLTRWRVQFSPATTEPPATKMHHHRPEARRGPELYPFVRISLEIKQSVMTPSSEEDEFLRVALAAVPRITEIIAAFPAEYRVGGLEVAKWRYMQ